MGALDKIKNVFLPNMAEGNEVRNDVLKDTSSTAMPSTFTSREMVEGKGGYDKMVPVGDAQVKKAWLDLLKYKEGKAQLEKKIISNEQWWKLRQWNMTEDRKEETKASARLWNVIVSKHAEAMDAFPEPNMLPRREDDREEAKKLTSIMPVILEQNNFRKVYSDIQWYKLKQGAGVYGIFWDVSKHGGLGDITVKGVDALSLFWESGIKDIQDSKQVFYVTLEDTASLEGQYPHLKDKLKGDSYIVTKYHTDDNVDTTGKTTVVDWYYHKYNGRQKILHYCKFAGSQVLFATENEPENYPNGWYDHGMYPFVIDPLFPIMGTPFGYGYIDIFKGVQQELDLLGSAVVQNALLAAKPRYFIRGDGSVNEEEFADWSKDFVHTKGNLGEDSIRKIDVPLLNGNYLNLIESKEAEMKENSGNWDANNGGSTSGVTAASAIAAMQEAGGKLSRDSSGMSYEGFRLVVSQCVELIRQFYDLPRQFRIMGDYGQEQFTTYSNSGIKSQPQVMGGTDIGYRRVEFDIQVAPQKATVYSKMAQNELAIQLYNLGVFAPQNVDPALALVEAMDFDHKEKIIEKIHKNADLQQRLLQLGQFALGMAQQYDPGAMNMIMQLAVGGNGPSGTPVPTDKGEGLIENDQLGGMKAEEHGRVANARAQAQESVLPTQ